MEQNDEKKKIIIVGAKEKISPQMLSNIQEHFNCEIEIMSQDEYNKIYPKEFIEDVMEKERENIELYFKRAMEAMDYLPSINEKEKIRPIFPQKTGNINNKKMQKTPRQYYRQKRGR